MTKTGLRPGLKLPPRVGGASTKRRVPVRTGAGLKLPPKPGAPKPAAAAGTTTAAAPVATGATTTTSAPAKSADAANKPTDDKAKVATDDKSKKPDDKGKKDEKEKKPKKKRSLKRMLFTTIVFLGSLVASAWIRVGEMEEIPIHYDEPEKPVHKKAKKHRRPKGILFDLAVAEPRVGVPVRLIHRAAKKPEAEAPVEETPEETVEAAPAEEAPKKAEIVKRVPADLFEDALLETVKMLRTMPQDDARRSAVNSFTDIARKEMNRSRECYAVINALQAAQNWDDLVVDTIVDNPRKRKITVGGTTHSIVPPFSPEPGVIVCNRIVNGNLVRNQRIALTDMSPKEKLAILRAERPDETNRSALFSRAFLELVYGSPKTFHAFVEKHKKIEGMKAFYVVYELERMK